MNKVNTQTVYIQAQCVLSFPIHNGIYLHNVDSDTFFTMEEGVATYIWTQLNASKKLEIIIKEVAKLSSCRVIDIEDDIRLFIEDLIKNDMIVEYFSV